MNNPNLLTPDYNPTYREKKFAVEVGPANHPMTTGEMKISLTHNGYQWTSLALSPAEGRKLIAEIEAYLTKINETK